MSIVTLTTDFGHESAYPGSMKGVMLKINPRLTVVDITHGIAPHQIIEAHYILKTSYLYFLQGTIHIAVVDPGVGGKRRALAVEAEGHFFLAPDNGLLSFLFADGKSARAAAVENPDYTLRSTGRTFAGRDLFAPAAAHLSLGAKIDDLGPPVLDPNTLGLPRPEAGANSVLGEVIYIDHFGNLITNMEEEMVDRLGGSVVVEARGATMRGLCRSYEEAEVGRAGAIINSWRHLEIFTPCARADRLLGAKLGDKVAVRAR